MIFIQTRKLSLKIFKISMLAVFSCFLYVSSIAHAEEQPFVKTGLQYRKLTTQESQIIHILEIDPNQYTILPQHAKGQAQGLDTLSALAKEYNAIAAINGGFFHMHDGKEGLPAGILKIKNRWYGIAYAYRAAVGWWENKPSLLMSRLQTKTTLKIKNHRFPINAVNQPGSSDRAVLFTDTFGRYADSAPGGKDFVIQKNRIIAIVDSGKTEIPQEGYVYAMGANLQHPFYAPKIQDKITLDIQVIPEISAKKNAKLWQTVDNIVGGTPLLISNGRVVVEATQKHMQSSFATKRRARTALGVLNNQHWMWVVVEKNQTNESVGMTLLELAHFMKAQNCQQAINLDGGGSSGMYLDGKLVTSPEEEFEDLLTPSMPRSIADAIILLEKN